jgi:hypothetical protein
MEIFRQLGLEQALQDESASNFDLDAGMLIVETLVGGRKIQSFQESDPAKVAEITPARRIWLTQNMFEPLLRERAAQFGSEQQFSTSVVHYEEIPERVIVVVRDELSSSYKLVV